MIAETVLQKVLIDEEKIYFGRVYNIHIKDRRYNGHTISLGQGNFRSLFLLLKK